MFDAGCLNEEQVLGMIQAILRVVLAV